MPLSQPGNEPLLPGALAPFPGELCVGSESRVPEARITAGRYRYRTRPAHRTLDANPHTHILVHTGYITSSH